MLDEIHEAGLYNPIKNSEKKWDTLRSESRGGDKGCQTNIYIWLRSSV